MLVALVGLLAFMVGCAVGAAAVWLWRRQQAANWQTAQQVAQTRLEQQLKDTFAGLAAQALNTANAQASQHLMQLAGTALDHKQQLIAQNLTEVRAELHTKLTQLTTQVGQLEKERAQQFGQVSQQLAETSQKIHTLSTTTADLRNALTNARTRGQWGERMAEDILTLAGLRAEVNYRKQSTAIQAETIARPDFTLLLPDGQVLHMDVKFPLENYLKYLNAEAEVDKAAALKTLLHNTRTHLKETARRDYPKTATQAGETSLPYLLLFVPNEQLFAFLLEQPDDLLAEALRHKIILCGPSTLIAVLMVIHTAVSNFRLQQQASAIQKVLHDIRDQWDKFCGSMEKMGSRLNDAQREFETLAGVRSRELDKRFAKLDALPPVAGPAPEAAEADNLLARLPNRLPLQ